MHFLTRAAVILALPALAACAVSPVTAPLTLNNAPPTTAALSPAADATPPAKAITALDGFVDPAALGKLSNKSRTEALSAQFNALQFGRVGAPRSWTGDSGVSGTITVGPFVKVNLVDCRDFLHVVTIAGTSFTKKGTACRETDGSWTVSG
jgi:surface antigen